MSRPAGFTVTAETRAKISAATRGIPKSPEHRAKLSAALMQDGPQASRHREYVKHRAAYFARANAQKNGIKAWLSQYRAERGCVDCGERDPIVLDFDHVRGVKSFTISDKPTVSRERLLAELEKCDVVCANDHRRRTTGRARSLVA